MSLSLKNNNWKLQQSVKRTQCCRAHSQRPPSHLAPQGRPSLLRVQTQRQPSFLLWEMAVLRLPTPALREQCPLDISVNRALSLLLSVDTEDSWSRPGRAGPAGSRQASCPGLCSPRVCSRDEVPSKINFAEENGQDPTSQTDLEPNPDPWQPSLSSSGGIQAEQP